MAFVTSHPIQYQVPVFRCLAARDELDFTVLFAHLPDAATQGAGFGVAFEWDLPLLDGYKYRVLKNIAKQPSVTQFAGCNTPEIEQVLREMAIDVVVVNGWVVKTCLQTLRACKRLKIPCLVRGEANLLRPRPLWKRLIQRQLVRRYDGFLPIGSANRDFYRSYGIDETRMTDARYCVENERFSQAALLAQPRRAELRKAWGIPESATCYLFCGKFESKKHPLELVNAFRDASPVGTIHLLMVGDGVLRSECENIAAPFTTFTGFLNQSQIVDAYVAADVLVLPSDHGETWGLVVNEAFACGLPAIVSDQVGCAQDLIRQGETGWVFPFGDWQRLTQLLVDVAGQSKQLKVMAENCRSLIKEYSPQAAADGIVRGVKLLFIYD